MGSADDGAPAVREERERAKSCGSSGAGRFIRDCRLRRHNVWSLEARASADGWNNEVKRGDDPMGELFEVAKLSDMQPGTSGQVEVGGRAVARKTATQSIRFSS